MRAPRINNPTAPKIVSDADIRDLEALLGCQFDDDEVSFIVAQVNHIGIKSQLRRIDAIDHRASLGKAAQARAAMIELQKILSDFDTADLFESWLLTSEDEFVDVSDFRRDLDRLIDISGPITKAFRKPGRRLFSRTVKVGVVGDLVALFEQIFERRATAPGDPPSGLFVEFVQGVHELWGLPPPPPSAIKTALYRYRKE